MLTVAFIGAAGALLRASYINYKYEDLIYGSLDHARNLLIDHADDNPLTQRDIDMLLAARLWSIHDIARNFHMLRDARCTNEHGLTLYGHAMCIVGKWLHAPPPWYFAFDWKPLRTACFLAAAALLRSAWAEYAKLCRL